MTLAVDHLPAATASERNDNSAAEIVVLDPLQHPNWDALLKAHPQSTIFHCAGWARVLRDTYGHKPVYICRFQGQSLVELLPIMEASSRVTGRRGVSLPFTDYCEPLGENPANFDPLYQAAIKEGRQRRWKYLECRDPSPGWKGATPSISFAAHTIDLTAGPDALFKGLDGSMRRGIRKAESAGLKTEFSTTAEAAEIYYALHCRTRQRHGLPPQPFRFFQNIQRHVLDAAQGYITIVRLKEQPVAAGVFLGRGRQLLYKFGASDFAYQELRPNNLMMWQGIRHGAENGFSILHLGRSSMANAGLRRFKASLGATEEIVPYCEYDFVSNRFGAGIDRAEGWVNHIFGRLPLPLLRLAGQLLYPHLS